VTVIGPDRCRDEANSKLNDWRVRHLKLSFSRSDAGGERGRLCAFNNPLG
jgi:hypothetical protein